MKKILFFTNCQKILSFIIENNDKEFYDREIARLAGVSRAGANFALRDLAKAGLINRIKKGRMFFYSAVSDNMIIKYLKIVQNIALINPLVEKLKEWSDKIILFGSAAEGKDTAKSDIDLFVISNEKDEVYKIFSQSKMKNKIKLIVKNRLEWVLMRNKDKFFYKEIKKGKVIVNRGLSHDVLKTFDDKYFDWVYIDTRRGRIRQKAKLSTIIDPRVVWVDYGWWLPEKGASNLYGWTEANINILTDNNTPYNREMGAPNLRGILCKVHKAP